MKLVAGKYLQKITLLNALGQIKRTIKIEKEIPQIPINDLQNGIYFCQILTNEQRVLTLKFVVSH